MRRKKWDKVYEEKQKREREKKGKDSTVRRRVGEKKKKRNDDVLLSFFLLVNYLVDDPFFDGRLTASLRSTLFPPHSQNE